MKPQHVLQLLRRYESRNITFLDPDGAWPIVWQRARGTQVWDAAGRKYLDLTGAFGVAAAGHANPRVVRAGQRQMEQLLHAMGDVHPHALKAQLARELSRITFERWARHRPPPGRPRPRSGKVVLANSGFEAVEAALKTARLATGRPGVLAFEGAYHGLGYGTLNTTHRSHFRGPFLDQLRSFGHFLPYPLPSEAVPRRRADEGRGRNHGRRAFLSAAAAVFRRHAIGAILVEPVQGRGGVRVPPAWFLPALRGLCDQHDALLVVDEIYTGFGRTGRWFACEHTATVPDLICLGKALTGGFPLSACVGAAEVMDAAWPAATGEAIHTSTFLGHPVGCAMALAQIREMRRLKLVARSRRLGKRLLHELTALAGQINRQESPTETGARWSRGKGRATARGLGLMAGLELCRGDGSPAGAETFSIVQGMLRRGVILLPEGEHGNVIGFTPPLTITESQIRHCLQRLREEWAGDRHRPARAPLPSIPGGS